MAYFIPLDSAHFAKRWQGCGISTLIVFERSRTEPNTGQRVHKISYYISNLPAHQHAVELFSAVRNHWSVEVYHHMRDVTFAEDSVRMRHANQAHVFSLLVSAALQLVQQLKPTNLRALLEKFADVPAACYQALRRLRFL